MRRACVPYARRALVFGLPAVWLVAATVWQLTCPFATHEGMAPRFVTCAAFLALFAWLLTSVRLGPVRELRRVREVARAAEQVLLRPLPPRLDGLALAAGQLSASRGATVGGDLYEAVATAQGVRIVIGDVRGHGLAAVGAVAALLGSFREAAHDELELAGVLRKLERALQRHLRERSRSEHPSVSGTEPDNPLAEEFATVLLLEIHEDGDVLALNCGHPWPYRLCRTAEPIAGGDVLPPLGMFPLPDSLSARRCTRLLPGEALVLHTDGAEDARNADGEFFCLRRALVEAAALGSPVSPAVVVQRVHTALLRHTGGRLTDDVALLVLRNDRRRVPAQPGDQGLRRSCAESSNR
ncbi:phosphatase [Streptomyces agglomeratus]|uniref:Phosphatase n=1 Tax=Streptomyces agglomeratus TaxID=285458 RepID=A0A1E5PDZ4_9ACTN|nr:phosphatase [Streptomyces agglomeratus]OEJ38179.1 phosphatase [Streptomyces agglomeratus]OEJ47437.1 phosphatase [Streptomyces agglomeratus]OEJ50706.1 phosphatase [Streptomyces agglomeratus]OEJ58068.1 phosphatase [Streptomyces agglomeratus]